MDNVEEEPDKLQQIETLFSVVCELVDHLNMLFVDFDQYLL